MTSDPLGGGRRAALGRQLSRIARDQTGWLGMGDRPAPIPRIGVTGAPGAGKSSLIGVLAARRAGTSAPLGILAIDPSSPLSHGSVLGDRIRMDGVSGNHAIFIRSLPSKSAHDGLCSNIEPLLRVFEQADFAEIFLETVGVGQAQHTIGAVVDTVVMVLSPHAGDSIQAMKAGLMEMADIYVVNKSDLPDARRTAAELRGVVQRSAAQAPWTPPVLMASALSGDGIAELSQAIDEHAREVVLHRDAAAVAAQRVRHHVHEVLQRRLADTIRNAGPALWTQPVAAIIAAIAQQQALHRPAGDPDRASTE